MSKTFEIIFKEFHNSETFVMSRALLEDYKAKAAQETEERIIKLLEHERNAANEQTMIWNILNGAIALIKGENK